MTRPIITTSKHDYNPSCSCEACVNTFIQRLRSRRALQYGYTEPPRMRWRSILAALAFMLLATLLAGVIVFLAFSDQAHAREGAIHPVPAPNALLKARAACPNSATPVECRSALRRAYAAVEWNQKVRAVQYRRDVEYALQLACASQPTLDCGWFRRMIHCESRGDPRSKNRSSTASGLAQFLDGTWSGNLYGRFDVFDPIPNALGAAWLAVRNGHGPWYSSRGCWA